MVPEAQQHTRGATNCWAAVGSKSPPSGGIQDISQGFVVKTKSGNAELVMTMSP